MSPQTVMLDSNILLRLADKSHAMHATAATCIASHLAANDELRTVPQSLFEFWAVATRPVAVNGLGLTVHQASTLLDSLVTSFPQIPDDAAIFSCWRQLIVRHAVTGKQAHDAKYVAAMITIGISQLLTFDSDFQRYTGEGITVVHPPATGVAAS